jgi:hypothetical protein
MGESSRAEFALYLTSFYGDIRQGVTPKRALIHCSCSSTRLPTGRELRRTGRSRKLVRYAA